MELSCEACAGDPQLKALSGCDEPTQEPVWDDGEDKFFSCPILFISPTVCRWYEEYAYAKELGTNIDFEDRPAVWLDAMRIYNNEYTKCVEEKMAKIKQMSQVNRSTNAKRY